MGRGESLDARPYLGASENCATVAFDVFDTLIVRPFLKPTDLFGYMERKYSAEGFASARVKAERDARRRIRTEINLDEIYSVLDSKFTGLKELEIQEEMNLSAADSDALALYEVIKSQGKEVILVSDMYLPRGAIEAMLEKNGFTGYSELYLSNELDLNKVSGSVYGHILGKHPSVLMIGDNRRSDVDNARSAGMKAERWVPLKERYSLTHKKEVSYGGRSPEHSLIAGLDMLAWQDSPDGDYWYSTARRFGGPMAFSFANFVKRESVGFDRVLFVSRDGYVPMLAYKEVGGGNAEYIHCSRMLSTVLGGNNLSDRDSALVTLEYFRSKGCLEDADGIDDFDSARRYISEHEDEMEKLIRDASDSYSRYARRIVGRGRVLMTDTTTMRYSSQRFLSDAAGADLKGCYYAVTHQGEPDHVQYIDRSKQHLTWSYVNLAEFFFSSAEPPLADVTADGPVFSEDVPDYEKYRERIQPGLERGQLDYVRYARDMLGGYIFDHRALDRWLDVLISYEKGSDPERLSGMAWGVDKGHSDYRPLLFRASQLPFAAKQTVAGFLKR